MAQQIQVQVKPRPRKPEQVDAPTVNAKLVELWFGGTS